MGHIFDATCGFSYGVGPRFVGTPATRWVHVIRREFLEHGNSERDLMGVS